MKHIRWICLAVLLLFCASGCGRIASPPATTAASPNTVTVTFAEGKTALQIAELLEENGVCDAQAFLQTAQQSETEWTAQLDDAASRPFLLEGYLFPDTYEFYKNESPQQALNRFLNNTAQKITGEYRNRAAELGMTVDEIVTLASIIQVEAGFGHEMGHVSSVLHNRLAQHMMLQCDVTYFYLKNTVMPYLCGEDWNDAVYEQYADLYYTYRFAGLPTGPICNPGVAAIHAALYPEDTQDLYFVTDSNGNFYYAQTYEEHQINCERAQNAE